MRGLSALAVPLALAATPALAEPPAGGPFLRMLGQRAQRVLEPHASTVGAVVRVPPTLTPQLAALGLRPLSPGFASLRGTPAALLAFSTAHPELPLEVAPPPHLLLDQVGLWTNAVRARAADGIDGAGALVGIADTGIDFTLDDFKDPVTGHTRIAWLLDLGYGSSGLPLPGIYPALEAQFGGAVFAGVDLENLLGNGKVNGASGAYLTDTVGHGTHVASIAAGNGGLAKQYVGVAPGAGLVIARITRYADASIASADLLTGVQFLFDRADAMNRPIAANLSIGSDFGPHDGTTSWEQALAAFVGPTHPGRALVVAAGNSGDISSSAVHASVYVPSGSGSSRRIPIVAVNGGSVAGQGQVQVWVTMRGDASLRVGLDAPGGTWIAPVGPGATANFANAAMTIDASVYNGASVSQAQIPAGSNSALVVWNGDFAAGTYAVTLEGQGVADLYVEGVGDAVDANGNGVGFANPVREGTVNLPGTSPGIIAVGCTVNRSEWTSIAGGPVSVGLTPLDSRGGYANLDAGTYLAPVSGDVCWFSSAGPTVTGVPKPEIAAPGGIVIAGMSHWAPPSVDTSIFYNSQCPPVNDAGLTDDRCMQVDPTHAVAAGTSMSAPQAAGAAALLFQKDPTLTQDKIVALLQAGAHLFRTGAPRFEDQGGPGELDVQASLDALDQLQNPALALPSPLTSWVTLSSDLVTADGSTPVTAIIELRTADGAHRADFFDPSRLTPVVRLDAAVVAAPPPLVRVAPGLWTLTLTPPPGLGGHTLTVGADFDGVPIVSPKTLAIATDVWTANYPTTAKGSCSLSSHVPSGGPDRWNGGLVALVGLAVAAVRRGRRPARVTD